ncbi:LysM peptidoglycan-binding domain-containing protein [Microbacter sp. GSS18]|nr:LysM peptidoglycan-binding domain-containing protein [Microbacter sp. GSS18]
MRRDSRDTRLRTAPVMMGVPAVVGSIALTLASAPAAHADSGASAPRTLRALPDRAPQTTTPVAPTAAAVPASYTVRAGDTVSAIASRFGLRTTDVLALNGLSWRSIIYPGQVLKLTASGGSAPAAAGKPSSTPSSTTYTVRAGDTVSAIASRHKLSTSAVLKANRLSWSSIIYPGQKLTIPGSTSSPASSSSGSSSAAQPSSGGSAAPASSGGSSYTVRAGDTISAIAARHGVSVAGVLSANGLGWSSIIYAGQKITIPRAGLDGLDAEQIDNARLIVRIGRELGVPDKGIAIALGTAMQESWIRNLDWGDRDSLGLFQQRPSTGWGTAEQVRNRDRAIRAFYGGAGDPNGSRTRGLLDVAGWQGMSFADAAQAVQISAYPDRYARWEKPAYAWLAALD